MSNSLDPDQARHLVGPDLDPNCLQSLSADDTSRQRVTINRPARLILILIVIELRHIIYPDTQWDHKSILGLRLHLFSCSLYADSGGSGETACTHARPEICCSYVQLDQKDHDLA